MTDRREAPPEWQAPRTDWQPGRHGHTDQTAGFAGPGYAYSPVPTGYAAPPPPAYPARHAPQAPARHAPQAPEPSARSRTHTHTRARTRRADASRWHWLLLVPIVLPLIPAIYNRIEPTLFGIPFFFWGQLAFAFLASAVITLVHLMVR